FEDGFTGWSAVASVVMGPPSQPPLGVEGTHSASLGIFDVAGATLAQTVGVVGETNYSLTFWFMANGAAGRTGSVRVGVEGPGGVLASQIFSERAVTLVNSNGFVRREVMFETPAGTTAVRIRFEDVSANGGLQVDPVIDDVQLVAGGPILPPPPP